MNYPHILLILLYSSLCISQTERSDYSLKWVNASDGLKQLSVGYCVPDNHGFVWLATELGLYRYDGVNLKEVIDNKYPSISKQRVIILGKDEKTGKIYLETSPDNYQENFQYVIENTKISKIASNKYSKSTAFTSNGFYFKDSNSSLKKTEESSFNDFLKTNLTSDFFYLPNAKHLFTINKSGIINNFHFHFKPTIVVLKFRNDVLVINNRKITSISNGKIINDKIKIDDKVRNYMARQSFDIPNSELFNSENNYYLKHEGNIFQIFYNNTTLTTKFLFKSPASDITSISYLKKDNIYFIGTRTRGMAILKPIQFNTISFNEKNSNEAINFCYSVVPISNKKWYSSSGWTFNLNERKTKEDKFLIDYVNTRFILPYKNKFYISAKNELWNIENKTSDYDFIYPEEKKNDSGVFSGFAYIKNQLYLTDANSIYFLKGSTFETDVVLNKKFIGKSINGIYTLDNRLILPTTKGVYSYSPYSKKVFIIKGLENVNARYIKPIAKNSFWVGCYGEGLFLVHQNKVHKVIDKNINITTTHALEEDTKGNYWISTNDGLLLTNKKNTLTNILKNRPIECYSFTTSDGLLTNEFNGSGTHPSLNTKEGIIGFTSMKGFVYFNPKQIHKHVFRGSIVMDKVVVDNKNEIPIINNQYLIPKNAGVISFKFIYGYYFNRKNLTIAYRFANQQNWTTVQGNSFEIIRYKKGHQHLIIKISTNGLNGKQTVNQFFNLYFEELYFEKISFWVILITLGVLFLLIFYFLGINYRANKSRILKKIIDKKTIALQEAIAQLESSKNSITQSLFEKEILLKEIHHRVKNNLQLVMSILNIQAQDSNEEAIHDFVEKGRLRIATMALIHQNLYQSENFSTINFQEYLEILVDNIKETFNKESIEIVINSNNNRFNLETAIPLGLIINELVCNSFKYAFPEGSTGRISILLTKKGTQEFELLIGDNGTGKMNNKVDTKSIGLQLVSLLVMQLNGKMKLLDQKGTNYLIEFTVIEI